MLVRGLVKELLPKLSSAKNLPRHTEQPQYQRWMHFDQRRAGLERKEERQLTCNQKMSIVKWNSSHAISKSILNECIGIEQACWRLASISSRVIVENGARNDEDPMAR